MKRILTAKVWHVFVSVTIIPAGIFYLVASVMPKPIPLLLVLILALPWYAWLYVVGTNLYELSGRFSPRTIVKFKLTLILIPLAWILYSFLSSEGSNRGDNDRVIFTITLLCIAFGTFFSLMQIAKALTAAQGNPVDSFKDYGGNFLTLWWLPFSSFWFLQKETRKLFLERYSEGE